MWRVSVLVSYPFCFQRVETLSRKRKLRDEHYKINILKQEEEKARGGGVYNSLKTVIG